MAKKRGKKIALLTNMVAPYRVPFFEALANEHDIRQLDILTCIEREVDREWAVKNSKSYNVLQQKGITLNLNKGADGKRILHFKFSIILYLLFKRPDVLVIGDASWTSFIAAFVCKILMIDYIVWNEITTTSKVSVGIVSKLRRLMYRGAKHLIASCEMATEYLTSCGVPEFRISIVNNAVDNQFFLQKKRELQSNRDATRAQLNIAKDSLCFIYVGQLISRKRVIETVKLISALSSVQKVHLLIAGNGPLENEMKQVASDLSFEDITFCGFMDAEKLCELYTASDSLILLSEDEPWGMVVNEALLFENSVIASNAVAAAVEYRELSEVATLEHLSLSVEDFRKIVSETDRKNGVPAALSSPEYMSEQFNVVLNSL
ncbi:glycosyltransferase [Pseudoalteromonas sp. BZB3]|uniref:glycosyltransferase n=1 Tax=Pseudoalteromonas sp. BZB3 TaxID=3136670 RepID=UPI0032C42811